MFLHSIFLSPFEESLPERIKLNIDRFKSMHADARHTLYTDERLEYFIGSKFGQEVLEAYNELVPLAFKADLGRYCLLYEYGGIYADLSIFFHEAVTDAGKLDRLFVFRDGFSPAPWITSNSIIAAPPKMPVFEKCILKICEHARTGYYGYHALCPTGPHLFGSEIARWVDLKDISAGEAIRLPSRLGVHNFAYISHAGEFIAVNYKQGNGIASLGAKIDDNYPKLFQRRQIYRRDLKNNPKFDESDAPSAPMSETDILQALTRIYSSPLRFIPSFLLKPVGELLCTLGKALGMRRMFDFGSRVFVYLDEKAKIKFVHPEEKTKTK